VTGPRPLLAVTPGEPAGIGPEIVLQLQRDHPEFNLVVVADPELLEQAAARAGLAVRCTTWQPGDHPAPGALACYPVALKQPARPGILNADNAGYVLETLQKATRLVLRGDAAALVTGPVHKGIINDGGFAFSGHTEFLAALSDTPRVVMMLAAPGLRVALVTTHLPLSRVADAITAEELEKVIRITLGELDKRFGIEHPRVQVLGLNPHAGESGHMGREEIEIIEPVLQALRTEGMNLLGPVPADTAFNPPRLEQCDAVIAMYHDQGLPVLKHMGFGRSVNITLGLPFIRTSVDHGTALDLAGKGVASADSLLQAVRTAEQMALPGSS
jgi:4-hydroxythreonine-4-phosphate dehydrogenase